MIDWTLPLDLVSPNIKEHWRETWRRNKKNHWQLKIAYINVSKLVQLPCIVTITRLAPRLWNDDNFIFGCKGIRDSIADLIIPGLAPGRADDSEDIQWIYKQEKCKNKGVRIQIQPLILGVI